MFQKEGGGEMRCRPIPPAPGPGSVCLVVGADRLGTKPEALRDLGYEVAHWSGRERPGKLPRKTALVVVLTGFVSHAVMREARRQAREKGIPVVYVPRGFSWAGPGLGGRGPAPEPVAEI